MFIVLRHSILTRTDGLPIAKLVSYTVVSVVRDRR